MGNNSTLVETLLEITSIGSTWVLWLLIALSVLSLSVIVERAYFFKKQRVDFPKLRAELHASLARGEWAEAAKICEKNPSFEARLAAFAIAQIDVSPEAMDLLATGFVAAEKRELTRHLTILGTLGSNTPFIGLLGTVLGIIESFHALSSNPAGGTAVVMSGISEALVATAVGLAVAIPAVIAYNTFQKIVKTKIEGAEAIQNIIFGYAKCRSESLSKSA